MYFPNEFDPTDCFDDSRPATTHPAAVRQAIKAKLNEYKAGVWEEFRHESEGLLQLIRLAVNEAEGLAWSTPYAHLLLPALVEEKIQSVRYWASRQDLVSNQTSSAQRSYPD
jgi:hypothetical protein